MASVSPTELSPSPNSVSGTMWFRICYISELEKDTSGPTPCGPPVQLGRLHWAVADSEPGAGSRSHKPLIKHVWREQMMFLFLGELAQTQSYLIGLLLTWWAWWLIGFLAEYTIKGRADRAHRTALGETRHFFCTYVPRAKIRVSPIW